MDFLRLRAALVRRHAYCDSVFHAEGFCGVDGEGLVGGADAFDCGNNCAFELAFWKGVEERQMGAEFVQFWGEVFLAECCHAFLVRGVGYQGEHVDGFLLLGGFGDVGG